MHVALVMLGLKLFLVAVDLTQPTVSCIVHFIDTIDTIKSSGSVIACWFVTDVVVWKWWHRAEKLNLTTR